MPRVVKLLVKRKDFTYHNRCTYGEIHMEPMNNMRWIKSHQVVITLTY
ncbi:predicted protein [Sclerotinia sclerotiorum 1980 UF-70]|uniref:Uncharacterized protein n=1 Tax=Sclerotinia sclerotiorum (strain ATCC 18683 / 1980 / Ss-1) TaxID=665079 RepID=A7EA46_SCLS1|nr:predicted protein [Sclerotinia sclerotiorum 1980 UF-70]EDN99324.1 predicted protein [Sclerotinia sclerotiorum 1980 UF-70]